MSDANSRVHLNFEYNMESDAEQTDITVTVTHHPRLGTKILRKNVIHLSPEQTEKFIIPIISIKKGYDPITSSLLYLNDEHCKDFFKRFIDEGTDWFTFTGIKVFQDGTWRIET